MEHQEIINFLDIPNTPNQPSKFRTRNWVEVNYELRGTCNIDGQIRFKCQCYGQIYTIIVMHI